MDENEIKNFINLFYQFKGTMGNSDKLNKHEIRYRKMFKKSIVFNKQKKIGEIIKKNDLNFIKNSKTPSQFFHLIVGKQV